MSRILQVQVAAPQFVPLYRLYEQSKGFHFYSSSAGERDSVVNTMPRYLYEGVSYYVISNLKLPHSGVPHELCLQAGNGLPFVDYGTPSATSLNMEQDGHRSAINPMSFSEVPRAEGGYYSRTECVHDNVTGLTWEGKEPSGPRSGSNVYTNLDDVSKPQMGDNLYPAQADIDATSNTVGYVAYVNSIALCGFTDWRLPATAELHNIVDYGVVGSGLQMDASWFPNHWSPTWKPTWSSTPSLFNLALGTSNSVMGGETNDRTRSFLVRLVRGGVW
ncbi:MAG: DUF1566 domain-containing protein [Burkholderiaceae bacterium]